MKRIMAALILAVIANNGAVGFQSDRQRELESYERFMKCFPDKAREVFEQSISPLATKEEQQKFGKQLVAAVGGEEATLIAVCKALGSLDDYFSMWTMISQKEFVSIAAAKGMPQGLFEKVLHAQQNDHQLLMGAARLFFWEEFCDTFDEESRAKWSTILAEVSLTKGWDGNKDTVIRYLARQKDSQTLEFLSAVFNEKVGKEIQPSDSFGDEPGIRSAAAVALALRDETSIKDAVIARLAKAEGASDKAAYEVCLALLGDPKYLRPELFQVESYTIGLAGLEAIEKFKGEHGMDALVRGALHHRFGAVRDSALETCERLIGKKMTPGEIEEWYEAKYEGKQRLAPLMTCRDDNHQLRSVAFSPDNKRVISGSNDSTARVWEIGTGKNVLTLRGHTFSVLDAGYSPDGKLVATVSGDKTLQIWNAETGELLKTQKVHKHFVESVDFSLDGKFIVTASEDMTCKIWGVDSLALEFEYRGHESPVERAIFHPDGKTIVSVARGDKIRFWNAQNGNEGHSFDSKGATAIALNGDGSLLAVGIRKPFEIKLLDPSSSKVIKTLSGHTSWISSIDFSPDGNLLASADWDKIVRLWDVKKGTQILSFVAHTNSISCVAFSPNGKMIATSSEDKSTRIWELDKLLDSVKSKTENP